MSVKILNFKITNDLTINDMYGPIIRASWEESKWFGFKKVTTTREVVSDLKPHKDDDGHDAWSWFFVSDGTIVPYNVGRALDQQYRKINEERAAQNRVKSLRPTAVASIRPPDMAIPPFPPAPSFRPQQPSAEKPMSVSIRPPKGKID